MVFALLDIFPIEHQFTVSVHTQRHHVHLGTHEYKYGESIINVCLYTRIHHIHTHGLRCKQTPLTV